MKHALKLFIAMGAFVATMAMVVLLADHAFTAGQWLMIGISAFGGGFIAHTELSEWLREEKAAKRLPEELSGEWSE